MWWRAVNEGLLRDGYETVALLGGSAGAPSSDAVSLWLAFADRPTGRNWYRAHNASIVSGQRLGRMLDDAVIAPRLQGLYDWSAEELAEPRLLGLVREGNPIYAWPFAQRHVWQTPHMPLAARPLERATRPRY